MKIKSLLLASLFFVFGTVSIFGESSILVFITDLYNQKFIKPQEQGSMLKFPVGVVSRDGKYYADRENLPEWLDRETEEETATKNPVVADARSIKNGKHYFLTYCAVCHGRTTEENDEGTAHTQVNSKGMSAPVIISLSSDYLDGYIFYYTKYGGSAMPPLGYATTAMERWDIINYIRTMENE